MNYFQKKKQFLMSIVNQIKGFVRTVSGVPPITLESCVDDESVINYQLYGNSVQDGEPTLDNPVEVVSVGEYDEESGKYKIPITATSEEGESITTNIYLNEPLRAIGDYKDYIDFEGGKLIRNVFEETITTIDGISGVVIEGKNRAFLSNISNKPYTTNTLGNQKGEVISNKFVNHAYTYNQIYYFNNVIMSYITTAGGNRVAYTFDKTITTKEQAQETIGEGFDAIYILDTPIEETIDLSTLPTFKGTTIYTIDTSVQPSNMEVTYYSTEKE